ncbi:MAG: hypothetical protein JXB07_07930 [Anaerolineae bacterium]|nr:hypothetical protein [Anaerolineae bacterium]
MTIAYTKGIIRVNLSLTGNDGEESAAQRVARETGPRLQAGFDCQPQMFPPEPMGER